MIQVYKSNNTSYFFNGDISLIDVEAAKVHMELNGIISLELTVEYDKEGRWSYLVQDNIIKTKVNWCNNEQLFRIYNTVKNQDSITAHAYHVFWDLRKIYTKDLSNDDVMIVDTGEVAGQQALDKIFKNTKFTVHSNITNKYRSRYERKNIIDCLFGNDENSFCTRWGGELYVDNYEATINKNIGVNNGVTIEYGKNLTAIEENVDVDSTTTRIIPTGYDGLRLTGKTPWVDSELINKYAEIHELEVNFQDVKVKDSSTTTEGFETEEEARKELIRLSKKMFEEEKVDKPKVTITVDFEELTQYEEYKDYKCLETVCLGDTVKVKHALLGIETETRCIALDWDVLTERYTDVTLGNVEYNYFTSQNDISNKISNCINGNGKLDGQMLEGLIDLANTRLKCMRSIAQRQNIRAMLFEDLDTNSDTFGATCIGSAGIEIASTRTSDNRDWEWRTAITGKSIIADEIKTGTLSAILIESLDKKNWFNLSTGEVHLQQGKIGNDNSYYDVTQALIHGKSLNLWLNDGLITDGNNLEINFPAGTIKAAKGRLSNADGSYYDIEGAWLHGKQLNIYANEGYISGGSSGQHYLNFVDGKFNFNINKNESMTISDGRMYNSQSNQDYVCRVDTFTYSDMVNIELAETDICRKTININIPISNMTKVPKVSWNIQLFKGNLGYTFDSCWTENLESTVSTNSLNVKFDIVYGGRDIDEQTNLRNVGYSVTGVALQS